jgi:hypothetical protein
MRNGTEVVPPNLQIKFRFDSPLDAITRVKWCVVRDMVWVSGTSCATSTVDPLWRGMGVYAGDGPGMSDSVANNETSRPGAGMAEKYVGGGDVGALGGEIVLYWAELSRSSTRESSSDLLPPRPPRPLETTRRGGMIPHSVQCCVYNADQELCEGRGDTRQL